MRFAILALAVLLQDPPPKDDGTAAGRQAQKALAWIRDGDPDLRELGRQALRRLGREAVPHIEARLKEQGALDLAVVLREIERAAPPEGARWVAPNELPSDEEASKNLPKLERGAAERYVQVRYYEALQAAKMGNFQKGYDMAGALLTLEPKAPAAEWVRKLRRFCDNMIMQTSLLEAKIVQKKLAYASDEAVELTVRLKNLHRKGITIKYDPAAGRPAAGRVFVEIETRTPEFDGSLTTHTRSDEIAVEPEIPIAVGAQWERSYTLGAPAPAEGVEQLRILVVNAWMVPDRIDAENLPITRRIQFEPAVVRVVPKRYERFAEKPLEALGRMIDTGTFEDVFICSLLLEGEPKDQGIELLIRAMQEAKNLYMRTRIGYLLTFMTDQRLGDDPKKWDEWNRSRSKKPSK